MPLCIQNKIPLRVGFPIRKSADQSLLAAPHGLSQRVTSFIASQCQGIHQMPLRRLIRQHHAQGRLRPGAHASDPLSSPSGKTGRTGLSIRISLRCKPAKDCAYLRLEMASSRPDSAAQPNDRPIKGHHLVTKPYSHVQHPPAKQAGMRPRTSAHSRKNRSLRIQKRKTAASQSPTLRWWRRTGSNRRPQACKASALPTELRPQRPSATRQG